MAKRGRPTDYDPEYHPAKALEFCAEFGMTDLKLARLFDVTKATINVWKKEYPEFMDSIREGKDEYDSDGVEKSLRRRSIGFRYTETTKELSPTTQLTESGEEVPGPSKLITTKTVRKFAIPDTKAIEFWLRNRRNKRWPDKQEIEHSGGLTLLAPEAIEKS